MPSLKQLQHEYDRTRSLWCIDSNPAEVDYEWIKTNAFQLEDYLKGSNEELGKGEMTIARVFGFTEGDI